MTMRLKGGQPHKSTASAGRELTETALPAVAGGFGGLALRRAIEIYEEQ